MRNRPLSTSLRLKRRKLGLESLESRLAMDGAGLTLVDDTFTLHQNGPQVPLDVLANDLFDPSYEGAGRLTSVSFGSEGGRIEIAPDGGGLLYTPPADFAGTETFDYAVDGAHTATVRVNVLAPLRGDRFDVIPNGETISLDVLANDPFWEGYEGPREITSVSVGSAGGLIEIGSDGQSINYAAPIDGTEKETFLYVVDNLYPARVTIDIPTPLREDVYDLVQHDPAAQLDVLANDPFWDGYTGERRITHVTSGQLDAEVEIAPDGRSLIYTTPTDSQQGHTYDYVTYVVDGLHEAQVRVAIYRPVVDDTFEVDQNSTGFTYDVTANDKFIIRRTGYPDIHRDVIDVVTSVTQSDSGGVVSISDDGLGVVYSPAPGFLGVDTFTYVADGLHEATVRVNVSSPVRDDMLFNGIYQDTPNQALAVLANDFLGNGYAGLRQITSVGPTENGGVIQIGPDGNTLFYTPAPGYTGSDRFAYTVDDELTATVILTVSPLTKNDSDYVRDYRLGQSFVFNVLANDHFRRGYVGPGEVTGVELVSGSADFTFDAGGLVTLTPRAGGAVSLKYTVDGAYEGTLSFSVRPQTSGDLLVADQNSGENEVSVLANDFNSIFYSYVGPRQLTGVTQSAGGGTVAISENGRTVSYTPPEDFYGSDTFTYTVDDFWTETVSVEVIRRVRDDEFRVDSDDGPETLPVLVNDLFGANYSGVGQITGVTATTAGGAVAIAQDGGSLTYTPAPGFSGTDTFTYTVDGALKAEVSVVVDTPVADRFPTFAGVDNYFDFLLADAVERYSSLFGAPAWPDLRTFSGTTNDSSETLFDSDSGGRSHSETNVQVVGVDEGDIVEFDADYAYVLTDEGVTIVDAWPAEELSIAAEVDIEGRTIAQFLRGDRLTVISETGGYVGYPWYLDNIDYDLSSISFASDFVLTNSYWPRYEFAPYDTIVTVIDVSDRESPEVVQTTTMEGKYVDSRSVDGQVYTLVSNSQAVAPRPEIVDEDNDPETLNRYETLEEFTARVTANRGATIEAALPNYTTTGPDGELVRTGLLNTPDTIHQPLTADADTLISVVSFDSHSDDPGLTDTAAVYSTGAGTIYASLDSFYVFDADYSIEDGAVTRIVKFDWDPASGGVELASSTVVPGRIIGQFSADEQPGEGGDFLRIATTASNSRSGNWSAADENLLFVLREDEGVMESVGSIQNWALNEDIRSVRFLGDRAFVTTARQIDPLFALDLTDPESPEAVGHITLPGFTSYMHLVDENHLLTVGTNTPTGRWGPTQVSLFDISNLTQPLRIAEHTISRFTTSEAQIDHHAFGYFAEHGLMAMPVASRYIERSDEDNDGYSETRRWVTENQLAVFTVDVQASTPADRLQLSAQIDHDDTVRRSGYIGDKLYSVGRDAVKVVDIAALDTVLAEVALPEPAPPVNPTLYREFEIGDTSIVGVPVGLGGRTILPTPVDRRAQAIAAARTHLAERLGIGAGEPLLVTAEATPAAPGGGETIVFRVDGVDYVYRIGAGRFEQAPEGYGINPDATAWNQVQAPQVSRPDSLAGDLNGDGVVNRADAQAWRAAYGEWSLTTYLPADANLDGVVDGADYSVWRNHLTQTEPESSDRDPQSRDPKPRDGAFADWRPGLRIGFRSPVSSATRINVSEVGGDASRRAAELLLLNGANNRSQAEEVIDKEQPPAAGDNRETASVNDAPATTELGRRLAPGIRGVFSPATK